MVWTPYDGYFNYLKILRAKIREKFPKKWFHRDGRWTDEERIIIFKLMALHYDEYCAQMEDKPIAQEEP